MVMSNRFPHEIAPAATPGVHLADEPQFRKYRQRAIDGNQSDTGVFPAHTLMHRCRRQMVRAESNYLKHRPPLRGEPVAALP